MVRLGRDRADDRVGEIRLLPGIWGSLHVDTAVTLPVGVEAYAAFALRVWLTSNSVVSDRTRRFARWSAIAALVLGMAGQVAYHLLAQAASTRAPWEVTTRWPACRSGPRHGVRAGTPATQRRFARHAQAGPGAADWAHKPIGQCLAGSPRFRISLPACAHSSRMVRVAFDGLSVSIKTPRAT